MSNGDRDYVGHLFEQMMDELKAVHELVAGQPTRQEFDEVRQGVAELRNDVSAIRAALIDTNKQIAEHETTLRVLRPDGSRVI